MSEQYEGEIGDIDKQLRAQFEATARARWHDNWEEKVSSEEVAGNVEGIKARNLSASDLLAELFKAIRLDEKAYYSALRNVILATPLDAHADWRELMRTAEAIARPNLEKVFDDAKKLLHEHMIDLPESISGLPEIPTLEAEIIASSEDGDLAQLLLDRANGLKRAITPDQKIEFLKDFPSFWHCYFVAKEKLGK